MLIFSNGSLDIDLLKKCMVKTLGFIGVMAGTREYLNCVKMGMSRSCQNNT